MNSDRVRDKLSFICQKFRIRGEIILYRLIPNGHINTAYYVALYDGKEVRQFLIQRVNWYVFREPIPMMHNIELITKHIMSKERTLERRRRLHFHHTEAGENYLILRESEHGYEDIHDLTPEEQQIVIETGWSQKEWEFWRLYNFIESSVSFETAEGNAEVLKMSGIAFGRFNRQLQDFDAAQLVESIPHFHDTVFRMQTFFENVEKDPIGRAANASREIEIIRAHREYAGILCKKIDKGELPIRVTHNDTKTNNILFDRDTLDPLVIIDLDTCMPGLACYDFGDTIRFAACTAEEDEKDTSKMKLDIALFKAYTEGYLAEMGEVLSRKELESLATGAAVITLELASRFLGDYLEGDKYFRIDYPEHNLVRARAQLALFCNMMERMDDMKKIIEECAKKNTALKKS